MKMTLTTTSIVCLFFLLLACKTTDQELATKTSTDSNGFAYEYVDGDLSKTRIYTLDNGLKVYLSVYKNEPRINTAIPVKAGGKFDPSNSTGLAHYLEHMLFKGTSEFGTKDWAKEKPLLDSIEWMFEEYRKLTDADERKNWYKKIDDLSNEASKYTIANEYDKMVQYIGAKGTNAYTTNDRTVYINDIPANQLENWLQIESERFNMIVNRLFHTELETVYEEKNRTLDNDNRKIFYEMLGLLFKKHEYGTQSVIGTIEHLKNPSIKDINEYFYKYYIPNNMAICLSGDLDPEKTIKLVNEYFGDKESKELEEYTAIIEDPVTSPRQATVIGPDSEGVRLGFRMGGTSSADYPYMIMMDYILNNSYAGLIDIDLVQKQKILSGGSFPMDFNDYSVHQLYGKPREGQTLKEVKDLLLLQLEKVKKGEFEDWLMQAIVNNFKKDKMNSLENNRSRTNEQVMAFTNNMDWKEYISLIPKMEAITKASLMEFANQHYQNNYGVVYKETGEDPNKIQVEKPNITKVSLDRATKSPFFTDISENEVSGLSPVFIDYESDLQQTSMKSDIPVLYKENDENDLFTLYYLLETGTNENPMIKYALDYLEYLGTDTKSPEEVKQELYKLACSFNVFSSEERVYVTLRGIQDNMVPAMDLFEDLLENAKPDEEVLKNMVADAHKSRSDSKKNKNTILWQGLMSYAKYGKESPFTNVLANSELNDLDPGTLTDIIKSINQTEHMIMYYGPLSQSKLISTLDKHHRVPETLQPVPERKVFAESSTDDPEVFWTDYDMVQAEILFHHKGKKYDKDLSPGAKMFNEYFGGMSGIAFQEIREAQGLAYSVFTGYRQGSKAESNDNMMAYVGTQADKQEEAMDAMITLLNDMPESEVTFENAKKGILETIESERLTKTRLFFNYLDAKQKDLDYDIRQDIYAKVKDMNFDDLKNFHQKYIKDNEYNIALIGDKSRLNFAALSKHGAVKELSLDDIFGFKEHIQKTLN